MAEIAQYGLSGHPDQATLLAFLDDDAEPVEQSHIKHCAHCQTELESIRCIRLALQKLPQQHPPACVWKNIQQEINPTPQSKFSLRHPAMSWLSMAASVVLVAIVVLFQLPGADEPANPMLLSALIEENKQLEAALDRLENQPTVMRLDAIGRITLLKDSVLAVDVAFGNQFDKPDSDNMKTDLLEKRIELMRELVEKQSQPMLAYTPDYHTF